ncbi:MAG: glycosyltransferase family 2 protein [Elusimicrobia bacterium]|nr:glycosyltransferase family 2 protein [Elusimicrobiota bacterium]
MVRVSLVVPTYNRAAQLAGSLPSFVEQTLPASDYEILVVDNNSKDAAGAAVQAVLGASGRSWRLLSEPRQGLHHARNKGLLEAAGDVVVFGDDDIVAGRDWLESILSEFDANVRAGVVGGRVVPLWAEPPPDWVYDYGTEKTHGVFAYVDHGPERQVLADGYVMGCNFAIRRELALRIGGSCPDTFPRHLKHLSGLGEYAMIDAVRGLGHEVVYLPGACVGHRVEPSRATLDYFIDRYERWAAEEVNGAFRNLGRWRASWRILGSLPRGLLSAYLGGRGKRNTGYFRAIQKRRVAYMAAQTLRLLMDPSLYRYVARENHLEGSDAADRRA